MPLYLVVRNNVNSPTTPAECPIADMWVGGVKVARVSMVCVDKQAYPGTFVRDLFLNSTYTAGYYTIIYRYVIGTTGRSEVDTAEVVSGGNVNGSVIAMGDFPRPEAKYVLAQTDGGVIFQGRDGRPKRSEGNA